MMMLVMTIVKMEMIMKSGHDRDADDHGDHLHHRHSFRHHHHDHIRSHLRQGHEHLCCSHHEDQCYRRDRIINCSDWVCYDPDDGDEVDYHDEYDISVDHDQDNDDAGVDHYRS